MLLLSTSPARTPARPGHSLRPEGYGELGPARRSAPVGQALSLSFSPCRSAVLGSRSRAGVLPVATRPGARAGLRGPEVVVRGGLGVSGRGLPGAGGRAGCRTVMRELVGV